MSTVLVARASTGVGLALAELLYPRTEHTLVLTARTDSLSRFADAGIVESARVLLRPLDVTVDDERRALIDEIENRFGGSTRWSTTPVSLSMSTPEKVAARIVRTIHNPNPPLRVRVTIDAYRLLMPSWVPLPRLVSIACGVWLVSWGGLILLGRHLRWAACGWMWDILQRSNFVKNLCLLGVCFHLLHHEAGKLSLEYFLRGRAAR